MGSKVIHGDIPDSGFVGHGVSFSWREPGPRLLASMMAASPLARVEAVTAPVLLAVSKSPIHFSKLFKKQSFRVLYCLLLSFVNLTVSN